MVFATSTQFDIRNHIDQLTPNTKEKGKYICPVCGGHNLSINARTGEYNCWNCHDTEGIAKHLNPYKQKTSSGKKLSRSRKTKSRQQERPAPIPETIELAPLPEQGKPPEIKQLQYNWLREKGVPDSATEQRFHYSDTQWVSRFQWADPTKPKGYSKTIRQAHIDENGKTVWKKGNGEWLPYRFDEIQKYAASKTVFWCEGEPSVEAFRSLSLVATTLQGSAWSKSAIDKSIQLLLQAGVSNIVIFPDHDDTGYKKAALVDDAADKHGLPCVIIDPTRLWAEMPSKGDVVDWIEG
ncbi:MAG: helicase superfamily 3, partial [Oscillatoria sp. PMC 1051.18]|nr:helicase superfamily 3 [Oscillatoria sp. PMC 1050.18]MEC5033259.1 helicase superfamily 3 [Oscillatoria sp. PMC 1051.18]